MFKYLHWFYILSLKKEGKIHKWSDPAHKAACLQLAQSNDDSVYNKHFTICETSKFVSLSHGVNCQ